MTNPWTSGTTYAPGATVVPSVRLAAVNPSPANPTFDSGIAGWNAAPGWYAQSGGGYGGGAKCTLSANSGSDIFLINSNQVPVTVGQSITGSCIIAQGPAPAGLAQANVVLAWFDAARVRVHVDDGNLVSSSDAGKWQTSSVTATAPSGAVYCAIGARGKNVAYKGNLDVDAFSWNYENSGASIPLVFTATQAIPGKSGATEPNWPPTVGATVIDNEVTWTGGAMTSVTWTASRIMESGATEPTWPTTVGVEVTDGTMKWVCTTPQVTDPNCPQSKYVAILASKVYAVDNDITRFSATVDPLDWSTQNDAGFLPHGLQNYGSNPVQAIGPYRSNLVLFNAEGFQMWQVDEDPANAALLDALPVGSTQQKALSPVSNDLFFLSAQGVRTMGIAGGSSNLQAGDVGMPIDPLVQLAVANAVAHGVTPLATYYPSAGQYFLAFPGYPADLFF